MNERRDVERAVVPLVKVVLFGFVDHGWRRMRQRYLSSLSAWLVTEYQASAGLQQFKRLLAG